MAKRCGFAICWLMAKRWGYLPSLPARPHPSLSPPTSPTHHPNPAPPLSLSPPPHPPISPTPAQLGLRPPAARPRPASPQDGGPLAARPRSIAARPRLSPGRPLPTTPPDGGSIAAARCPTPPRLAVGQRPPRCPTPLRRRPTPPVPRTPPPDRRNFYPHCDIQKQPRCHHFLYFLELLLLENGGFSLCCLVVPWVIYLGEAELVPDPDSRVLELEIVTKLAARCTEAERSKPIISELDWMLPACCLLSLDAHICELLDTCACPHYQAMATFELYRRSTIDMCLTETLDEMVSSGTLSPELAIQVLIQVDKFMTEEMENQVNSKATVKSCCCYDHVLEPGRSGACRERRAMMRFRVAAPTLTSRKICSRSRKLGLMECLSLVFVLTL